MAEKKILFFSFLFFKIKIGQSVMSTFKLICLNAFFIYWHHCHTLSLCFSLCGTGSSFGRKYQITSHWTTTGSDSWTHRSSERLPWTCSTSLPQDGTFGEARRWWTHTFRHPFFNINEILLTYSTRFCIAMLKPSEVSLQLYKHLKKKKVFHLWFSHISINPFIP